VAPEIGDERREVNVWNIGAERNYLVWGSVEKTGTVLLPAETEEGLVVVVRHRIDPGT
jgi:hypothetical protein